MIDNVNDPRILNGLNTEILKDKETIIIINKEINDLRKIKREKVDFKETLNHRLSMYTESIHIQTHRIDREVNDISLKIKDHISELNRVKMMVKFKENLCN